MSGLFISNPSSRQAEDLFFLPVQPGLTSHLPLGQWES